MTAKINSSNSVLTPIGLLYVPIEKFSLTVQNKGNEKKTVAILPSIFNTLRIDLLADKINYTDASDIRKAGHNCDIVLDDDMTDSDISCTPGHRSITMRAFRNHIKENSLLIKNVAFTVSNVDCFNNDLEIAEYTPLTGYKTFRHRLSDYKSVNQFDQLRIDIRGLFSEIYSNTLLLLSIPGGRSITIDLQFVPKALDITTDSNDDFSKNEITAPAPTFFPICYGDKGKAVRSIQESLNIRFGEKLVIDGVYGDKTKQALLGNNFITDVNFQEYLKIIVSDYAKHVIDSSIS